MTLFEDDRHHWLETGPWDADVVRAVISDIGRGLQGAQQVDGFWLAPSFVRSSIYLGAGGILWAVRELQSRGHLADDLTLHMPELDDPAAAEGLEQNVFAPFKVPMAHSFLMTSPGALLAKAKLTGEVDWERLLTLITANRGHPWLEFLWGAPASMQAAAHAFNMTGDDRFAEEVRLGADHLWQQLTWEETCQCRMWNIDLYGKTSLLTGAGHGFAGNVVAVLNMRAQFSEAAFGAWREMILTFVLATAQREGDLVNWPPVIGPSSVGGGNMLVQWCHGAPGFVINLISLYGTGSAEFDAALVGAGELIWKAGPLTKYPSLCHGTPGNGYAFLKLYKATGDEVWLTRARAFAMAAIQQWQSMGEAYQDDDRYGLWTGDAGLMVYLADCLDGRSDFPTLDYF
ncbi:MAG: hypothetical protein EP340_09770 [Alphaproteobacteria bacterium]|nr:MAG: hypothetical protein EP340_09770 [Alphaproteobacteria bacterium]